MKSTRRLVLTLVALVLAFAAVPGIASAGFSVSKLRLGSSLGPENYLYTAGDTVYANGTVDAGTYYRFAVSDPTAVVRSTSACTAAPANSAVTGSFSVQSSSLLSTGTAWRYQLQQFAAAGCAGSPAKNASLYFDVTRATAYSSSALTTPKAAYGAAQVAYVNVQGIGKVKGGASNPAVSDWSVTWLLPLGTACANTGGGDRPDSTSGGFFPTGTGPLGTGGYLQYRPNLVATGDAWNRESNYETKPCADFSSSTQGAWRLYLKRDNTHFVTLPVFTVDTTAPETSVTGGPAGPTNSTSANMQFTSDATNPTFQCRLDGGGWAACSSPKNYSGLSQGVHTFDVRATDEAGNVDPTPATRSWTIDTTLPPVTLTSPADGSSSQDDTPQFTGTAGTAVGDSSTVTVKIYSGATVAGSPAATLNTTRAGDGSWSVTASSLADGTYTAYAQQSDNASNTGFSEQHTFTIDATGPIVTLIVPAAGASTNVTAAQLRGTGGTLTGDDDEVTIELYNGTAATGTPLQTQTTTLASNGTWSSNADPELAEGIYTARAVQSDDSGNTSYSAAHVFTVDTTAPTTTITAGPAGNTSANSASFRFVSSESGSRFQCRIDDGTWGTCTSPKAYFALGSGAHTFEVRAIDRAGNVDGSPDGRSWTVNGALPDILLLMPADGSSTNDTTPTLSGTAGTAAGDSSTVTVKVYSLSSGSPVLVQTRSATRSAGGSWSVAASPSLSEGEYVAHAEQTGTAGTGYSAENEFAVDTTPANTFIDLGPYGSTTSTNASFSFGSSEEGSTFECRLDGGAWTECTSPQDYSGLAVGTHTFDVRSIDAAGNVDASPDSLTWTIDPNVPAVSIDTPANGSSTSDDTPLIGGVAGTAAGDDEMVSVEVFLLVAGGPDPLVGTESASRSSGDGTWSVLLIPGLDEGTYVVRASQAGTSGTGYSAPRTFTIDTTPPSAQIIEGPTGSTTATTARFRFVSSESGSTFQCRLDGGSWAGCSSPVVYTGLSEESHTFDVRAIDAAGNVDPFADSRTWIVDPEAPPVTLTAPDDDSWTNDSTPMFAGTAGTDVDDDANVTVEIYDGTNVSGDPVAVLTTTRSSLDGTWSVVASPALADGTYVAFAEQSDVNANTGYSSARTFTVDTTPSLVTLTAPAADSSSADTTPQLVGSAGTEAGDSDTVTVKVYSGSNAQGSPVRTLVATAAAGAWSIDTTPALAAGTYTARAEQGDLAGNTGHSASRTFTITSGGGGGGGGSSGGGGGSAVTAATGYLALTGSVSPTAAAVGSALVWRFRVTYMVDWGLAQDVYADFQVPAGVTITSTYSDRGAGCQVLAGGNVHCDLGGLFVGAEVNVILGSNVTAPGELRLTGTTGSRVPDPAPEDNTLVLVANTPTTQPAAPTLSLKLQRPKLKTLLKKGKLLVYATCDQACTLKVTVKFKAKTGGKTRVVKITKTVQLSAAKRTTLQLKLTKKARAVVLKALAQHKKVTVNLAGAASATSGAKASAKLTFSTRR